MDPNANLAEQRRLVEKFLRPDKGIATEDAIRLAELVQALDAWIVDGGFLPKDWGRK